MPVSDDQMNRILANIAENIPSDCSTGRRIRKGSTIPGVNLNSLDFDITDYEAYRNDIEFVNSFSEQVLADESNYFNKKYGEKVYQFLLAQRNEYITERKRMEREELYKTCPFDASRCKYIDASNNKTKCDASDNELFNYLKKLHPPESPATTYKKIEYRDEAHELLSSTNNLLTMIYFVILFGMFIFLAMTKRLLLKERSVLYLFLIVLPFIFPYFFDILKKLYKYMFPNTPTYGPKNAFLETHDPDEETPKKNPYEKRDDSNVISYNA